MNRWLRKEVIVLRGVSGSGKTTAALKLARRSETPGIIVSADDFFVGADGSYQFDVRQLQRAHDACLRMFVHALRDKGVGLIIVDNTNIRSVDVAPYARLALAFGASLRIILLRVDPATAAERCVHGVGAQKIRAQAEQLRRERFPREWGEEEVIDND